MNLLAVIVPGAVGLVLLAARPLHDARPAVLRATVVFLVAACLADWVLIEDLGFFGGLGTDPNSMIPLLLVVVAGYLALTPAAAAPAGRAAPVPAAAAARAKAGTVHGPSCSGRGAGGRGQVAGADERGKPGPALGQAAPGPGGP